MNAVDLTFQAHINITMQLQFDQLFYALLFVISQNLTSQMREGTQDRAPYLWNVKEELQLRKSKCNIYNLNFNCQNHLLIKLRLDS